MPGLSLQWQKKVGDHLILVTPIDTPAGLWMSLHTADPTDAGSTAAEVSTIATNYGRFNLEGKMSAFDLSTGEATLTSDINIGPAFIDWGLITHVGFWEQETGGTMIFSGALSIAQNMTAGKQFQLLAGQMALDID